MRAIKPTPKLQAKLKIGSTHSRFEKQADRVADSVMTMADQPLQMQPSEEEEQLQMQPSEEEEELQMKHKHPASVQMAPNGTSAVKPGHTSNNVAKKITGLKGNGQKMPTKVTREMSQKIGADFSDVTIHKGKEAAFLNKEIGARAFTYGKDIYFNSGEYNPASSEGKHLLAHELTHVVQQGGSQLIQRQETFDFSDEEGSTIVVPVEEISGRGREAGEREVEAEINKLRGWVGLYLSAYRDGLNSFSDTMSFSSDAEAQPRYFDVALKEVGKVLLDELINYATAGMPIVGPVVKGAKSVITSLYNEAQRAQSSQNEATIRSYIVNTRNAISEDGGIHRQLLELMDNARPILLNDYRNAVEQGSSGAQNEAERSEMEQSQGVHGVVTGEAARFIRDLRSQTEEFKERVPTASEFQRRFTEAFADTSGLTDYVSQGGEESGSLHLEMDIYRERNDDGSWSIEIQDTASSWELATSAPNASRLAQNLNDTVGGSVDNTSLPKYLHVRVETEVFGLNEYSNAIIYFENSNQPDFRGWDVALSRWIWSHPTIVSRALSVNNISER